MAGVSDSKKTGRVRKVPAASRKRRLLPGQPVCKYLHRHCFRPCLDGYNYCSSHVLADKTAPFRPCIYVHPESHKKCTNTVPKNESFCVQHIKGSQIKKSSTSHQKSSNKSITNGKHKQFLSLIERYCQDEYHDPNQASSDPSNKPPQNDLSEDEGSDSANPSDNMQYLGSSFGKKAFVSEVWVGESDESASDFDDSDRDDPLRHAGVVTYEEALQTYYNKLVMLQSKYVEEFRSLYYFLLERRRDYLRRLKTEKRIFSHVGASVTRAPGTSDRSARQRLRAIQHYHRPLGQEAVLHKWYMKRRQALSLGAAGTQPSERKKCRFSAGEEQCSSDAIVFSEFCFEHIMKDPKQRLFKYCPGDDGHCKKTVVPCASGEKCVLHTCIEATPSMPSKLESSGVSADTCDDEEDAEHFQSMDDIASLGLDAVVPGSLFGLNQFGEPSESTDSSPGSENHFLPLRPTDVLSQGALSISE